MKHLLFLGLFLLLLNLPSLLISQVTAERLGERIDIRIQKTNHSLFSIRMDPDLAVINGGTMVNAAGENGDIITLRYRVLVHSGNHLEAGLAEQFEKYVTE